METEPNVNGGAKLLTAGMLMTLGVGGALLFQQDPASTPRPDAVPTELLVRRSGGPATAAVDPLGSNYAPQAIAPQAIGASAGFGAESPIAGAQLSGGIDPFRAQGTPAATQGRLTADYGGLATQPPLPVGAASVASPYAISGTGSPFPPTYRFIDPTSEAERTPLNNVAPKVELPATYPGASKPSGGASVVPPAAAEMTPVSSAPRAANGGGFPSSGISNGGVSNGGASLNRPFINTGSAPRAVMPTLHAGSGHAMGSTAPPPVVSSTAVASAGDPFGAPSRDPTRPKNVRERRHRVRDGDTLASLAVSYYGDAERYLAIYEANRGVVSNPDVLTIGSYLTIPSADEATTAPAATSAEPPPAARLLPRVQIRPYGE